MRYFGLLGVAVLAYFAGVAAYLVVLAVAWRQPVGRDLTAILFWGGLAYVLAALPLYLVFFTGAAVLRRYVFRSAAPSPAWLLPLVGALLGLAPTYLILRAWGGGLTSLFTPEGRLFYPFFGVSGFCFGAGWWWLFVRSRSRN